MVDPGHAAYFIDLAKTQFALNDPEAARQVNEVAGFKSPADLDSAQLAAWTMLMTVVKIRTAMTRKKKKQIAAKASLSALYDPKAERMRG